MEFQIAVHVQEKDESSAIEWLKRLKAILEANRELLVSPSTGHGTWCEGHVMLSTGQNDPAAAPGRVLQMGPRE